MNETRVNTETSGNPTKSDSGSQKSRILGNESDLFVARLKEVIGDQKLTRFAAACGVGESTLRNILSGAWPRTDLLIRIAETAGVTLDWLATGHEPRTRAELRKALAARGGADPVSDTWRLAVELVQEWQVEQGKLLPPDKFMRAVELLVELSEGEPEQVRQLSAKVLHLAA